MTAIKRLCLAALLLVAPPAAAGEQIFVALYGLGKNDGGYNQSAVNAIERLKRDHNILVRERVTYSPDERSGVLRQMAANGATDILMMSFDAREPTEQAARAFPDIRFTLVDAELDMPNVRSVLFREDEAGFLAGAAAGFATKTNRIGFVGAIPIPAVQRFGCGYLQGARRVNAAVAIDWRYIGGGLAAFRNAPKAIALAQAQIDAGADVIFTAAGHAGVPALRHVAEQGRLGVGVDRNQNDVAPGAILTSAVKSVEQVVYESWSAAVRGRWTPGVVRLGAAEGAVGWAIDRHNAALVAPFRGAVEALGEQLASGALVIDPFDQRPDCAPQ